MSSRHHNATNHFVVTELTWHRHHHHQFLNYLLEFERRLFNTMQQFTHPVGDTHLYGFAPTRPDGTAGVEATPIVYTVDNPLLVSLTPNPAVSNSVQVTIGYLAAGTATVTATGTNENGTTIVTSIQIIVTVPPPPVNATDHFVVTELT